MGTGTVDVAPQTHILVVEDDTATAEMLVLLLEFEHYRVSWAATPEAALATLGAAGDHSTSAPALPDLVLLDLQLPSMSGPELMRAVARRTATPPPVIVMSAWREAEALAAADAIGARAVVLKPFAVDDLLDRIAAVERGLR